MSTQRKRVLIMGAAGRDFHNFNTYFRGNKNYEVVAFTAEQIPGIEGRMYPKELAGEGYENGIPIHAEADLPKLIKELKVDECILAYSDLHHEEVMKKASLVLANGADFKLMGTNATMIKSTKPVIAVCAVRTGVGKSQTTRAVVEELKKHGKKAVVIRHPMPYGDLVKQAVQRYEKLEDLDKHECTIEEREEYENHIEMGNILYAGVDYEKIIREAEKEADVILWDGGNNDYSFYKTDLHFTLVDPHRPGHELTYYPGAANVMMANVLLVAKCNTAEKENIDKVMTNIKEANPNAQIVKCDSIITCEKANELKGKKVLVVEDGPTLTHGEMRYGAGTIAAKDAGAEVVDPKEYAVGSILDTFKKHPHLDKLLPAMGYGAKQIKELEETINKVPCDYVLSGTPIDLSKVLKVNKPIVRVKYEYKDNGEMAKIIEDFVKTHCK
jgi:predicted GTPase